MRRIMCALLAVVLVTTACAFLRGTQPTKPKVGHWEGSDPTMSFDITDEGQMVNLQMTVPYGGRTCGIYIPSITVQTDYSITIDFTSTETLSIGYIIGVFHGTKASGKYLIKMCSQGVSFVPGEDEDRDWSAEWKADSNSSTSP
jgi:hypothetical protein